ncbi:hypothetical protein VI817_000472 [Penicillium citrinum]|nr:hypothetical protein VI817_000472 [Penicillium citrinum]
MIMKQFPGKSWEVIQRLETLRTIQTYLKANDDPCKELPNVGAIIAAYEAGTLEWNDNATYWCQGKMIGGPSPFSFETFHILNTAENRGDGGFWVEGIYRLPMKQEVCKYRGPPSQTEWDMHVAMTVRLDASIDTDPTAKFDRMGLAFPEYELDFIDDTGSYMLTIFNDDMLRMMGSDAAVSVAPLKHLMGYHVFDAAGGFQFVTKIIAVQATIIGENEFGNDVYMAPWNTICCSVYDTNSNTPGGPADRLNGNWLRKTLFCATAPLGRPRLFVGLNKKDLMARDMVPKIRPQDRTPPEFIRPQADVAWRIDMMTGLYHPQPRLGIRGMVPPGGYIPPAAKAPAAGPVAPAAGPGPAAPPAGPPGPPAN